MMITAIDPGTVTGFATGTEKKIFDFGLGLPSFFARQTIIEKPEHYLHGPVPANSLAMLFLKVGELSFAAAPNPVYHVLPKQWKGQTPKEIHNQRTLKKAATQFENWGNVEYELNKIPITKRHNIIDAIGLLLFALQEKDLEKYRYKSVY